MLPWKYWNSRENRKAYIDHMKSQLGGKMEDVYKLTGEAIYRTGGTTQLTFTTNSRSDQRML